jgi:hypothetical protein
MEKIYTFDEGRNREMYEVTEERATGTGGE